METIETNGESSPPDQARQAASLPQDGGAGATEARWIGPGVSPRKRLLTGIGVALAAIAFIGIARWQGASMLVSTIIGVIFIGCFVWYLAIVAPRPFTLTLDAAGITRAEAGGEPEVIAWSGLAKIKIEVFKSGKPVSLTVYRRVGERGLHRAWVVYRDDVPRFDELLDAVHTALPEGVPWIRETIHE
jgi:hypothetical protein